MSHNITIILSQATIQCGFIVGMCITSECVIKMLTQLDLLFLLQRWHVV